MKIFRAIFKTFSPREKVYFFAAIAVFIITSITRVALAINEKSEWVAAPGGVYKEGALGQPIALNPIISANSIDKDMSALIYSPMQELLFTDDAQNDGRIYVLKLKENLKWSDGQPLTSDDVIFTIKTIQDPETKSPFYKNWEGVVAERISELQFQLALPAPYVFMEENIRKLPIIPKHIFGNIPTANFKLSVYNLEPVGSGPYAFGKYSQRKDGFITEYRFKVNDFYAGEKPFIKEFYFKFYENRDKISHALRMREITGFGTLNPLNMDLKKNGLSKFEKAEIPMARYYAIFFNQNMNPILKNSDIRYALTAAIDKDRIVREVLKNEAETIQSPLTKNLSGLENQRINYDPEQAKNTLSGQGIQLTLLVPKIDFLEETAKIIKENWLANGVRDVNIIALEPEDLFENAIKTNNYEMVLFGNVLENPRDLFSFWHSSERFYPGLNLALYQNSRVDSILEAIRETEDGGQQNGLLKSAERIIVEDKPAIFLFSLPYNYVYAKNLGGFEFKNENFFIANPTDRFQNINKWHLAKARVVK